MVEAMCRLVTGATMAMYTVDKDEGQSSKRKIDIPKDGGDFGMSSTKTQSEKKCSRYIWQQIYFKHKQFEILRDTRKQLCFLNSLWII